MLQEEKKSHSYKALLTQKQFLKLVAADVVNRFGDSVDAIALSMLMYAVTGSAAMMSLILGLNYIPTIVFQPVFGVLVERMNKKCVMVLMDVGRGAVMVLMMALFASGRLNAALLTAATLLNSTLEAFRVPAGIAVTPMLLDAEQYTTGSALSGSLSRVSEIVGLVAAGAVVAGIGLGGALLVDAATFLISAAILCWVRLREERQEQLTHLGQLRDGLREGVRYILRSPKLMALFLLGMLLNFCLVPLNSLGTAYVVEVLGQGAEFLSYIQLALVAGLAAGSAVTPKLTRWSRAVLICTSGSVSALSMLLLGPVAGLAGWSRMAAVLALMLLVGLGIGVQSVVYSAAFMQHVDKGFLSRIGGLTNAFLCAAMPLGAFLCSGLAAALPVSAVLAAAGALMLAVYGAMSRMKVYREL